MDHNRHWVGTWTTSPAPSEARMGFSNHTIRMHRRVSICGNTLRVRVSNVYGSGHATTGRRTARSSAASDWVGCCSIMTARRSEELAPRMVHDLEQVYDGGPTVCL
jgi:hypothetical protein